MTPVDTVALRALVEKATKGPWRVGGVRDINGSHLHLGADGSILTLASFNAMHVDTEANAALVVAAVNELLPLLDEVEALREALEPFAAMVKSRLITSDDIACVNGGGEMLFLQSVNLADVLKARAALGRSKP